MDQAELVEKLEEVINKYSPSKSGQIDFMSGLSFASSILSKYRAEIASDELEAALEIIGKRRGLESAPLSVKSSLDQQSN